MISFKTIAVNFIKIKVESYNELAIAKRMGMDRFNYLYEHVNPSTTGLSVMAGSYEDPEVINIAFVKEMQRRDGKSYLLIEDLLKLGADPNAVFSRWGQLEVFMSVLAFAKSIEDKKLIQLLIKYGARMELEAFPA